MPSRALLLHVGYHKTATSWMQQRLFQPRYGFRQLATHREVFSHVVQPHGLRFDPAPMRDLIAERQALMGADDWPVISSEILSGHPFQGGHESDVYAERLARIAPDARILISIRAQSRILPSVYSQYLLRGGTMPPERFFQGTDEIGYFGFTPEHFDYDRLTAHYQRLFGADRVYVLTQESLKADMPGAVVRLAAFLDGHKIPSIAPEDRRPYAPSYPEHAYGVLRRINHLQSSTLNASPILRLGHTPGGLYKAAGWLLRRPPFSTLFGHRRPVTKYVARHFAGRYRDSNARLAALVTHPLDLSDYDGAPQAPAAR